MPMRLGPPMRLQTERLALDPLVRTDAARIYLMMSDPEVMAHWDVPETDDPDLVDKVVGRQVQDMEADRARYWTMRTLGEGEFVGVSDLSDIDLAHRRADIGFMLRREAWGQGFALEAMRTIIAHAAGLGFRRLTARTQLGNRRSETLLANLKFKDEGRLRGHIERDGIRRDCRLWGLLL
jgi:ribosomal-protein-alanine N-acetyltransferase